LRPDVVLKRARHAGKAFARLRLQPYRTHVNRARLMHDHPLLGRAYCVYKYLNCGTRYCISLLFPLDSGHLAHRLMAIMWMSASLEYLRVIGELEEYSLWKRPRRQ